MNTKEKLDKLADLRSGMDAVRLAKQELIDTILTPEIKKQIQEIEFEFEDKTASLVERIAVLEKEIKDEVARSGESLRGEYLIAVYSKARSLWDSKGLDGYAVAHPEILSFRRFGEPSVSIRAKGA